VFTINKVILHHSLTRDSGTVSWGDIRRYHVTPPPDGMGLVDIGYHAGIELIESGGHSLNYEILTGRMWNVQGAHTRGQNKDSLGICFVGNFDIVVPPDDLLKAGAKVVALWLHLFDIPVTNIFGHKDFADKSCPGVLFDINKFRTLVETVYDMA